MSKNKANILLIEDNAGDILLVQSAFDDITDLETNFITKNNGFSKEVFLPESQRKVQ